MNQKNKRITLFGTIVIVIVIISVAVAALVNAAYIKRAEEVNNAFKSADSIVPGIKENFDGDIKENVYFTVDDPENDLYTEYPLYVRVKLVFTWQDKDEIVYYKTVEDEDYFIKLNENDWEKIGDYYYYKYAVQSGDKTSVLIEECRQIKPAPADGYTLSVEILVQTVQAVGYTDGDDNMDDNNNANKIDAWKDAWNIS